MSGTDSNDGLDLVAEATGSHVIGITSRHSAQMIGQRYPLHASSSGKVLLAEHVRGKDQEHCCPSGSRPIPPTPSPTGRCCSRNSSWSASRVYGIIDNELEEELISLSRPVRDSSGTLVAILTLNGPRYRFGRAMIPAGLQRMQHTVEQLVRDLLAGANQRLSNRSGRGERSCTAITEAKLRQATATTRTFIRPGSRTLRNEQLPSLTNKGDQVWHNNSEGY